MAGKKGMFDKLYPTPPGYMTIAQTAERLGRTRGCIWILTRMGELGEPKRRDGDNAWLIPTQGVEDLIKRRNSQYREQQVNNQM